MKLRILFMTAALILSVRTARAEDVNINEKPETTMVSLMPYSLGVGAGVFSALNTELQDESPAFLKLSIIQSINFADRFNLGLDADWLAPGNNWGGELSLDYLLATGTFKPFFGAGGGIRYFDKANSNFGHDLGVSGTVHVGMIFDVMDELQLRIRVPFTLVANDAGDRGVGLDVGILFSSPQRTSRVKKLKY